jgi:hypothetical protein
MCYVHARSEGKGITEAYRECYDTKSAPEVQWVKASELEHSGKVSVWLDVIKTNGFQQAVVTKENVTNEANEAINLAKEEKQPGAMLKGIEFKAKVHGLLTDQKHVTHKLDVSQAYIKALRAVNAKPLKTKESKVIDITPDEGNV